MTPEQMREHEVEQMLYGINYALNTGRLCLAAERHARSSDRQELAGELLAMGAQTIGDVPRFLNQHFGGGL